MNHEHKARTHSKDCTSSLNFLKVTVIKTIQIGCDRVLINPNMGRTEYGYIHIHLPQTLIYVNMHSSQGIFWNTTWCHTMKAREINFLYHENYFQHSAYPLQLTNSPLIMQKIALSNSGWEASCLIEYWIVTVFCYIDAQILVFHRHLCAVRKTMNPMTTCITENGHNIELLNYIFSCGLNKLSC